MNTPRVLTQRRSLRSPHSPRFTWVLWVESTLGSQLWPLTGLLGADWARIALARMAWLSPQGASSKLAYAYSNRGSSEASREESTQAWYLSFIPVPLAQVSHIAEARAREKVAITDVGMGVVQPLELPHLVDFNLFQLLSRHFSQSSC